MLCCHLFKIQLAVQPLNVHIHKNEKLIQRLKCFAFNSSYTQLLVGLQIALWIANQSEMLHLLNVYLFAWMKIHLNLRQIYKKLNHIILPSQKFIIVPFHIRKSKWHYKQGLLNMSWWLLEHLEQNSFFILLYSNFPLVFPHLHIQKSDLLAKHSLHNTIYETISFHRNTFLHCKAITRLKFWQIQHLPSAGEPISWNVAWDAGFYAILFHTFYQQPNPLILSLLEPVFWAASFPSMLFAKMSFVAATEVELPWSSIFLTCYQT